MQTKRCLEIVQIGQSLAVLIPPEFHVAGTHAIVRQEGQRLVIEPDRGRSLLDTLQKLSRLEEDFGPIDDDQP